MDKIRKCNREKFEQENLVDVEQHELDILKEKAGEHCKQQSTQRLYLLELRDQTVQDWKNNIPFQERHDVIVCDYSQNLDLPHFGNEQPGESYYWSPLGIYIFGTCNYATETLNAYTYHEGEGDKGGNNVSSLIWKYLSDTGIVDLSEKFGPGKKLSIVFDNCPGQNKNRIVLRFAAWMLEKKLYSEIEIVFLICGHTKNICDRMFAALKRKFHFQNIMTFKVSVA